MLIDRGCVGLAMMIVYGEEDLGGNPEFELTFADVGGEFGSGLKAAKAARDERNAELATEPEAGDTQAIIIMMKFWSNQAEDAGNPESQFRPPDDLAFLPDANGRVHMADSSAIDAPEGTELYRRKGKLASEPAFDFGFLDESTDSVWHARAAGTKLFLQTRRGQRASRARPRSAGRAGLAGARASELGRAGRPVGVGDDRTEMATDRRGCASIPGDRTEMATDRRGCASTPGDRTEMATDRRGCASIPADRTEMATDRRGRVPARAS